MSDTALYPRPGSHPNALSRCLYERSPRNLSTLLHNSRTLSSLPFDVLLMIIEHLDPEEVVKLQAICRTLREFASSRPIWVKQAVKMLDLCRPLPISAFQRVWELDSLALARLVRRAVRLQYIWTKKQPKLVKPHREISAPPNEDIVWLSPITSKYTLCCTKSGKVLCWDVFIGECVAQWQSGADWEIWKCRVEFEERTVYFAMARKIVTGEGNECQLMALTFPIEKDGRLVGEAKFEELCVFRFPGHVISVYILDPARRLLSAYIWIIGMNTLGLYLLMDWNVPRFVYLNTGISCEPIREWSCIGYDPDNIVIHAEEEKCGLQFFYPYSFLQDYATDVPPTSEMPLLVPPPRTVNHNFIPNDHYFETYQVQSSHFVRQWWPTLPHVDTIRRRSCTIVLLTTRVPTDAPAVAGQPPPGTHLFTIGQHYFSIPLKSGQLRWWYVREPFEIVCVPHVASENEELVEPGNELGDDQDQDQELNPLQEFVQGHQQHEVQAQIQELVPAADAGLEPEPPLLPPAEPAGNGGGGGPFANFLNAADGIVNNFTYYLYGDATADGVVEEENEAEAVPAAIANADTPPEPVPLEGVHSVGGGAEPQNDHDHDHDYHVHDEVEGGLDPLGDDDLPDNVHIIPLIAVDFGCAAWVEYVTYESDDKRLRFVTFPRVDIDRSKDDFEFLSEPGAVRTLEVPPEIDLGKVCHIGIDQAQGSVILGLSTNQVYVMRYD